MSEIESCLVRIHRYWKEWQSAQSHESGIVKFGPHEPKTLARMARGPEIGRNDPCPCGSGKIFKICCATEGTPPSLQ